MRHVTVDYEQMTMTVNLGEGVITLMGDKQVVRARTLLMAISHELDAARSTAGWMRKAAEEWQRDTPQPEKQLIAECLKTAAAVRTRKAGEQDE